MVRHLILITGRKASFFLFRGWKLNKYNLQRKRKFIKHLGSICGIFRKKRLKLTLRDMARKTGVPISTLNSFEQGRSSSLNVFYVYLVSCETQKQAAEFLEYIVDVCLINWR